MTGVPIRRSGRQLCVLALGLVLLVTGCDPEAGASDRADGAPKEPVSAAEVDIAPGNGTESVATLGALKVFVTRGTLVSVTVRGAKGRPVAGEMSRNRTGWQPSGPLDTATRYTVHAVAKDAKGLKAAAHSTFTTVVPKGTFIGYFTPEDGSTVGVGMPVSLNFNRALAHRQVVRRAIQVTAEPSVPVKAHWFGDRRLDFRPEHYWEPGTKVTLRLQLKGVEGTPGFYGTQRKTVTFTIGRRQVSVVDAAAKKMTVRRDGEVIKTIPVTTGAPGRATWNGTMVISERHRVTRMDGATVGFGGEYDIDDVPHAMRLSTSGTFIHGNYWMPRSTFGSANVSHGCIGMYDRRGGGDKSTPAAWFFRHSLIGDVVEVKRSKDRVIAPDNGLSDWNLDWSEWGTD